MIIFLLLSMFVVHHSTGQHSISHTEMINSAILPKEDVEDLPFRRLLTYESSSLNEFSAIPQPGGFQRIRRDAGKSAKSKDDLTITDMAKEEMGNFSDWKNNTNFQRISNKNVKQEGNNNRSVEINDFIRFRRETELKMKEEEKENDKNVAEITNSNNRREEIRDLNVFSESERSEQQRTGRMLLPENNDVPEGSREPRGVVKEQWIRQLYPVHSVNIDDNIYDDNIASAVSVAPRVNFVTQRRLEPAPPSLYRTYEREGRTRDMTRENQKENPGEVLPRSVDRNFYTKRYNSYPSRPYDPYHDDPYYRYEESRYDPRYGPLKYDRERPQSTNRQRRIIYYATLPEVVRTPPNVNLRDRYSYRDRYDDRYINSPSFSPAEGSSYRYRKPYSFTKSRYEHEMERTKTPYPLKVSTDVNVRETKKNPERRIYSESDNRYAYKTPYRSGEH